jgi:hypothetical protein
MSCLSFFLLDRLDPLDLLDLLSLLDFLRNADPNAKSASEEEEDELPKEKKPFRCFACCLRRLADDAEKKEIKPVDGDLLIDRPISTYEPLEDEDAFRLLCLLGE